MKSSLKKLKHQESLYSNQIDDLKRQADLQNEILLKKNKEISDMKKLASEILMIQRLCV